MGFTLADGLDENGPFGMIRTGLMVRKDIHNALPGVMDIGAWYKAVKKPIDAL